LVKDDAKGDSKVRQVPRRLTAFVGRLHIDTAESDLQEFLSEACVLDVKCKKLTPGLLFELQRLWYPVVLNRETFSTMRPYGHRVVNCETGYTMRRSLLLYYNQVICSTSNDKIRKLQHAWLL